MTLLTLSCMRLTLLFSDSPEETAGLLARLARVEACQDHALPTEVARIVPSDPAVRFLLAVPGATYAAVASLIACSPRRSLRELCAYSAAQLCQLCPWLGAERADALVVHLHRRFGAGAVNRTER